MMKMMLKMKSNSKSYKKHFYRGETILIRKDVIKKFITSSDRRFLYLAALGFYNKVDDVKYLKRKFKASLGYSLNLNNPQTFNEKLQWLKLYDHKPEYTTMVDKYAAKKYVSDVIGEQYIIPTLGVWDSFDAIDFKKLPEQFVLKTTHDSGGVVICKNKNKLDKKKAQRILNRSMKRNFYYLNREWPYKNITPRIIAEEYLQNDNSLGVRSDDCLVDYKLQCINGKFDNILCCTDRVAMTGVKYYYFDRSWNYLSYSNVVDEDFEDFPSLKPKMFDEMVELSERLANDIPELRVDFYEVNGKVYFGELTFFSNGGFDDTITQRADIEMGKKLRLPEI